MKNLTNIFQLSLLAVLLCAAGLFISSAANAQSCELCDDAKNGRLAAIQTRCDNLAPGEEDILNNDDNAGRTALLLAAKNNHTPVVEALLEGPGRCNGATPHSPNDRGRTPFMWAAQNGHVGIGMELVEKVGELYADDLDEQERQMSLLVNYRKDDGRSAADIALQYQKIDFLVEAIVRGNAEFIAHDVFAGSRTIKFLGEAPMSQHARAREITRAILRSENLNPPFADYRSLFHWAVSSRSGEVGVLFWPRLLEDVVPNDVRMNVGMQEVNFIIGLLHDIRHRSVEDALAFASRTGNVLLIKVLVAMNADIESVVISRGSLTSDLYNGIHPIGGSAYNFTPLVHAVWHGHADAVSVLLDLGADIRYDRVFGGLGGYDGGWTPLMVAAKLGQTSAAKALLDHDSTILNLRTASRDESALDIFARYAAEYDRYHSPHDRQVAVMASLFVSHAHLEVGHRPLALVARFFDSEVGGDLVRILLTHNNARKDGNGDGQPVWVAAWNGNLPVMRALTNDGADVELFYSYSSSPSQYISQTPLMSGLRNNGGGNVEHVVTLLIDKADSASVYVNAKYGDDSYHPLVYLHEGLRTRSHLGGDYNAALLSMLDAGSDPRGGRYQFYSGRHRAPFLDAMLYRPILISTYLGHISVQRQPDLVGGVLYHMVYGVLAGGYGDNVVSNLRLLVDAMRDPQRLDLSCADIINGTTPFITRAQNLLAENPGSVADSVRSILEDCGGWPDDSTSSTLGVSGGGVSGASGGVSGASGGKIIAIEFPQEVDEIFIEEISFEEDDFLSLEEVLQ